MTNQDDWTTFCAMMEVAGWFIVTGDDWIAPFDKTGFFAGFTHAYTGAGYYSDGTYFATKTADARMVPDWREWLAAGTSPPPF